MHGWKLVWAKDKDGEIGTVPKLPVGCVELDITAGSLMEAAEQLAAPRKRR